MINTQKLLEISELKLSGKIEQMDEGKLNNFVQLLNSFSDNLPALEKKINDALVAKNNDALKKFLTAVRDILVKIYAEEMAQDCTKQIGRIGAEKHEKIEAYMRYFLSTLSMLSADIQKAQQQTGKSAGAPQKDAAAAENESINKKNDSIILEKLLEISELNTERIEQMEEDEFINIYSF